ncbi:glycerophosphodiester phosphodiesterase [Parabacteroides sp. 52]|uniref:glycerophosphodiester phosphodiesterase n=1 Tax=unclassified Parabacteroides TaxID=2649774 RepID=UPI0013D8CE5E|nr:MULTISPECIES: glycerophosphodiester phosphodiesterase family protein [unclassified Parabacteroides]MDH6534869.1 glycerophosphoryl diester phosphodiesterase [Parabacteroides sp. PM5-20]NDV55586.1 glycerophosphodiester phosphodiesterase [Parabacteroides sp. 52]
MKKTILLLLLFSIYLSHGKAQTQAIAHRGFWKTEGSAQNTLAALQKAHEIGIYGSEFDVWLTADGVPVVNHDDSIPGFNVQKSTLAQLRTVTLANGEKIPTLEEYLKLGKKLPQTQLVLEIKSHRRLFDEDRLVRKVVDMVKLFDLEERVDYIAFSMNVCKELKHLCPQATVVYLNGDLSPQELKEAGFSGLDYRFNVLQKNPGWIKEAKELGLTTNVWTVNTEEMMSFFINEGVDFITTDNPALLKSLLEKK